MLWTRIQVVPPDGRSPPNARVGPGALCMGTGQGIGATGFCLMLGFNVAGPILNSKAKSYAYFSVLAHSG